MFDEQILLAIAIIGILLPLLQAALSETTSVAARAAEFHVRKTGENLRSIGEHLRRGRGYIDDKKPGYANDQQYVHWIAAGEVALWWRRFILLVMFVAISLVALLIVWPGATAHLPSLRYGVAFLLLVGTAFYAWVAWRLSDKPRGPL